MPLTVRFMRREDIPQVTEIDHDAFPTEWPPTNFPRELDNKLAYYIVVYEAGDITPPSDVKPPVKEMQPGFINRMRSIFVRAPAPQEAPVKEGQILGFAGMYTVLGILFLFLVQREIERGPGAVGEGGHVGEGGTGR